MADGPNLDDDLADETDGLRRELANLSACNRLTTIPGSGPINSLAFRSTIDIPQRYRNSKAVGPILGLTPKLNESGESKCVGCIAVR